MFVCFVFLFQSLRAYSVEAPEFGRSFPATSARPAGEHWAAEPASVHKAEEASFPAINQLQLSKEASARAIPVHRCRGRTAARWPTRTLWRGEVKQARPSGKQDRNKEKEGQQRE